MNKLIIGLLVGNLVLGVLGLYLPTASVSLGGTTRDDIVIDADSGRLTNGFALTVTGDESSFAGTRNSSGSVLNGLLIASTTKVANFVQGDFGGSILSITDHTTLTAAQVCQNSLIQIAPSSSNMTLTLPTAASTTAESNCLTADGDTIRLFLRNTTSGAATVTLATSTGSTTFHASSSVPYSMSAGVAGTLELIRASAASILVHFERLSS